MMTAARPDYTLNCIQKGGVNIADLGGEVELTLSKDGKELHKFVFTEATMVYVPAGLYHCPLNFKKVDKPIIFINIFFAKEYSGKSQAFLFRKKLEQTQITARGLKNGRNY